MYVQVSTFGGGPLDGFLTIRQNVHQKKTGWTSKGVFWNTLQVLRSATVPFFYDKKNGTVALRSTSKHSGAYFRTRPKIWNWRLKIHPSIILQVQVHDHAYKLVLCHDKNIWSSCQGFYTAVEFLLKSADMMVGVICFLNKINKVSSALFDYKYTRHSCFWLCC